MICFLENKTLIKTLLALVVGLALCTPAASADKMYWAEVRGNQGAIRRANLDGTGVENLITSSPDGPNWTLDGIAGVRLPQAVLVCNFPNPRDSRDGLALMEHDEVVTLFHEFGHLLHTIFSGHRRWIGNAGITTEWDFVEAPSQMLEEWCYNVDALRTFAGHHRTGEPIPAELVEKLRRASDFGKGLNAAHQMSFAALSLNYYNRDPKDLDTTELMIELQERYSPFDYVDDTHFQCSFGHLDGYSAYYYTYMWSLVIAKDLFSRFERNSLLNTKIARRYGKAILEPGGSKKAAELIKDFLGRPHSFHAFEAWLNRT